MLRVPLIKNPVRGLDCSHYDASIDFNQVKAAGYEFCWAKATEGAASVDARYAQNAQKARAAGILFGAYHFFRPAQDPIVQAKHFLDVAQLQKGDLLPMFDWEVSVGRNDKIAAKQFLDHVEATIGKKMVIYGGPYFLDVFALTQDFAAYPLNIAHYTSSSSGPLIPKPWKACSFQQYTDRGSVPGIPADGEDMDLWNGSLENLKKMVV